MPDKENITEWLTKRKTKNHTRIIARCSKLIFLENAKPSKGRFKCYVTQMGVGGGGSNFPEKALRRCKVQCYLALRGGGWGPISMKKALCNT